MNWPRPRRYRRSIDVTGPTLILQSQLEIAYRRSSGIMEAARYSDEPVLARKSSPGPHQFVSDEPRSAGRERKRPDDERRC